MAGQLQPYADIKYICDKIEKAALLRGKAGDRVSLQVASLNSLESLDQVLFGAKQAIESTQSPPLPDETDQKDEDQDKKAKKGSGEQEEDKNWYISTQNEFNSCEKDDDEQWEAVGMWDIHPGGGIHAEFNPFQSKNRAHAKALAALGFDKNADLAEAVEHCFGCDMRVNFDFQLQPINLLLSLDELLKDIEDILNFWKDYADPLSFLKNLCPLWNMFGEIDWCIQDWIAILLALQALMAKYAQMAISISLDWTVLFGPLLKLLLDAISQLIEQIIQVITAPLDCAIGALETIQALWKEIEDTLQMAEAVGKAMSFGDSPEGKMDLGPLGNWDAQGKKMDVGWPGDEAGTGGIDFAPNKDGGEQGFLPKYGEPEASSPPSMTVDKNKTWGSGSLGKQESGEIGIPTGFNMKANDTLEDALKDPNFHMADPFEKIILALRDCRAWLVKIFSNILFTVKSLNALVSGGIGLNLKSIGMLMLILDIINFIKLLISLTPGTNPCEEDLEEIANIMRNNQPDYSIKTTEDRNIVVSTPGGHEAVIVIPEDPGVCRPGDTDRPRPQGLGDLEHRSGLHGGPATAQEP
jgi:hypothetical protein